jgi:hypothetical protein
VAEHDVRGVGDMTIELQQPNGDRSAPRHETVPVVLDFVHPVRPGRRLRRFGRQTWGDEAGRQRHGAAYSGREWLGEATVALPFNRSKSPARILSTPQLGGRALLVG